MAKEKDVQDLATKLKNWAENELPEEQQYLLKCLLTRGAYTEERVDTHTVKGTTGHVGVSDIKQAVVDALAPDVIKNLPSPIEGWPRFNSPWLRENGGWLLSGNFGVDMFPPPKLPKPPKPTNNPV